MVMQGRVTAVIAERLTEMLRSLFVGRLALDAAGAAAVRSMMQAGMVLGGSSEPVPDALRRDAVARIKAALGTLGITGQTLAPGSALAAYVASCHDKALSSPMAEQSFLTAADDLDVVTRLLADGAAYSDAPDLRGNIPETGVWARRAGRGPAPAPEPGPIARLKARVAEIAQLCAWLDGGDADPGDDAVASYRLGAGRGAAAVECARGRLYHAVALDEADRIVNFEFLAPTEWNFHARGPLVRSLRGSLIAAGRRGQEAVRVMVDSFDPCVGFSLKFREAAHA